jgi:SAM-dependent methyltransferase
MQTPLWVLSPDGSLPVVTIGSAVASAVNVAAVWHDLECGAYREDLPLWRALADEAGGPVLDVGAGTGRVSLDLAARGVPVVALDIDAALLKALRRRAEALPIETVAADARELSLGRRFSLVVVPMQTLQLLGGPAGRAAFLRRAREHLEPGGLVAAALADALASFDEDHDVPPPPDVLEIDGVRYVSQLLAVVDEDGRAAIHRRRAIVGPGERYESGDAVVQLDRVSAREVVAEARDLGFLSEPDRLIPETEEFLGSTVVVLRAPGSRRSRTRG